MRSNWLFAGVMSLAVAAALGCSAPVAPAETGKNAAGQAPGAVQHVVLVSVDGLRPDALAALGEAGAPAFHRLMKEGAFTLNARTDYDFTVTLPNHTCMVTGRPVEGEAGHGYSENSAPTQSIHNVKGSYVASVFDVVHDHGLRTAIFASKAKFVVYTMSYDAARGAADAVAPDNGKAKIDAEEISNYNDPATLGATLRELAGGRANFVFVHFADTDKTGHADSWDLAKDSPYLKAVAKADAAVGKLMDAIAADKALVGSTVLLVTTDHGGIDKAHKDAADKRNYTIPFFAWGAGVAKGADLYELNAASRKNPAEERVSYDAAAQPIRNGDAANLALKLLGLPAVPGSTIGAKQDLLLAKPDAKEEKPGE